MCITEAEIMAVDIQPPSRMLPPQSHQSHRDESAPSAGVIADVATKSARDGAASADAGKSAEAVVGHH